MDHTLACPNYTKSHGFDLGSYSYCRRRMVRVQPIRAYGSRHATPPVRQSDLGHHLGEYVPMYHHHLLVHLLPACLLPIGQAVLAHDGGHRCHAHLAAVTMSRWGRYKAVHMLGFTFYTLGLDLFSRHHEDSPTIEWVGYMLAVPSRARLILNTQLPAFQAPIPDLD